MGSNPYCYGQSVLKALKPFKGEDTMNKFLSFLKKESNFTTTENGAVALKSTNSSLVDLFGVVGGLRNRQISEIERLFGNAFAEDALIATKMAFYARNIRSGLGERRTFRAILNYMGKLHPELIIKNFDAVAFFGRYDDFYSLVDTPAEEAMWVYLKEQLIKDITNCEQAQPVSLLAKWLKSVNASSSETNNLGKLTAKKFGLSEKTYRKTLSKLRNYLDVTEIHMANNTWTDIIYSQVPSKAMAIYRNAFKMHDETGFTAYLDALVKGTATVNAGTLYPYDIIERMGLTRGHSGHFSALNYDQLLEAQWKSLPNYVSDGSQNILIMADTSCSMIGRPLATALGLAIYFAERTTGPFKNTFMTFSASPSLVTLKGTTLYDKLSNVPSIVSDTNLEAAFSLVLSVAKKNHLSQDELPKSLLVITDMEFNQATTSRGNWTFYESMKRNFAANGYQMPNVIFWNVNSRNDCFQVTSKYEGVQLASGQSPSVFKSILSSSAYTPYDLMLETLSDPIYDCITA